LPHLQSPARYVTGYVPDVAFLDPGTPMDFHAYFEVYIGHHWHVFDARFNVPRIGRFTSPAVGMRWTALSRRPLAQRSWFG
jgi:transglutaminase-like putative cysteine protease